MPTVDHAWRSASRQQRFGSTQSRRRRRCMPPIVRAIAIEASSIDRSTDNEMYAQECGYGVSFCHIANRMRARRRASATIAIFFPRRRVMLWARARRPAVRGFLRRMRCNDRHEYHYEPPRPAVPVKMQGRGAQTRPRSRGVALGKMRSRRAASSPYRRVNSPPSSARYSVRTGQSRF